MRILICLTAILTLIGCTSTKTLGERAVEYNKELEESTNITMLMNVVRASERMPMTFSRLGSMSYTGSTTSKPSTSFGVGAGSNSANDLIGLSIDKEDSGVTEIQALTGEKYYRAITKSITPEAVAFYRDRGWPDLILFSLFIERVEVEGGFLNKVLDEAKNTCHPPDGNANKVTTCTNPVNVRSEDLEKLRNQEVFDNYPGDLDSYAKFRTLAQLVNASFEISLGEADKKRYDPSPYCTPSRKAPFTKSDCDSLIGYEPAFEVSNLQVLDLKALPEDVRLLHNVAFRKQASAKVLKLLPKPGWKLSLDPDDIGCTVALGDRSLADNKSCKLTIFLRSPVDMIYYVGELVRAQGDFPKKMPIQKEQAGVVNEKVESAENSFVCDKDNKLGSVRFGYGALCASEKQESLFYLMSSDNPVVSRSPDFLNAKMFEFEYNGRQYWVSSDQEIRGRTMQIVSLLNEIFALQQEASEAPAVSVIQGATIQ